MIHKTISMNQGVRKSLISLGIAVLLLGGFAVAYIALNTKQDIRSHAGNTGPKLFMTPSKITDVLNKETSVNVFINTYDKHVSAAEVHITYDKTAVEITKITMGAYLPKIISAPTKTGGVISFTVASIPESPQKGSGLLATIQVKPIAKKISNLTFRSDTAVAATEDLTNVLGVTTGTAITFTGLATPTVTPADTVTPTDLPEPTEEPVIEPTDVPAKPPEPIIEEPGITDEPVITYGSIPTDTPYVYVTDAPLPAEDTATPTVTNDTQTLTMRVSMDNISDAGDPSVKTNVTILSNNVAVGTYPVTFNRVADTIFEGTLSLPSPLPVGPGYTIRIKGEKHSARKFCQPNGQTQACSATDSLTITQSGPSNPQTFDFTGRPLLAGDTTPQDGRADISDMRKIIALLATPCDNLSADDKMVGDLDYSGCVDVKDIFLMRKAMENPYDE